MYQYLEPSQKWILNGVLNEKFIVETERLLDYKNKLYGEKVDAWKEKALHREFAHESKDVPDPSSWRWLKKEVLEDGNKMDEI